MRDAVICSPLRTAVGRFGGVLSTVRVEDMSAAVISALVERTGISPSDIDEVIFGQGYPNGEAPALGRIAALNAGLGITVPGFQVDRRCGSGLQAIVTAAMEVQTGVADLVLAGGAESMSQAEHYVLGLRTGVKGDSVVMHDRLARGRVTSGGHFFEVPGGMIETAENLRRDYNISREAQDELAYHSHQRAVLAQKEGRFDNEIVPIAVTKPRGESLIVDTDEHPRADTTTEQLAKLRPIRNGIDPQSTVTAGNASGQNDAAAVCIVTTMEKAHQLGLTPLAKLLSWSAAGVDPRTMGLGPVPATQKALSRAELRLSDMDLIEINEAFAAQVLAVTKEWKFTKSDFDRTNVNGSGISLGHPIGATGGRILATMLNEMQRRGSRYGLETMCIGGGQGIAAVFESLK
ncbi:MAG: acetyl-CoA C-acetyltransferase [Acidimicrobiaceae bacterium]|nr:acetyl-CoA C-acetyltransferase [Acidimicrobiaceae bacterium]